MHPSSSSPSAVGMDPPSVLQGGCDSVRDVHYDKKSENKKENNERKQNKNDENQ